MRTSTRGVARLLSCTGLAAALVLPAAGPALAAPPSRPPSADGKKGQELPGMPSALAADSEAANCTPAS
ncbi:serine protease, partial [Streptomyces sp. NPDC005568]